MKINNNYTNNNINFGYDKKLNAELKSKLSTYSDRGWAQTLSSMNNYVNKLEGSLSAEAKNNATKSDSRYHDYLDLFLSLKEVLAGFVSITFDDLNYADREFNHYYDEFVKAGSPSDDWRMEACSSLKDWVSPDVVKKLLSGKKTGTDVKREGVAEITGNTKNPQQNHLSPDMLKGIISNNKNSSKDDVAEITEITKTPQQPSQKVQDIADKIVSGLSPKSFLEEYQPTANSPKGFQDVAGMSQLKRDLYDGIIQLIQNPEQAQLDFEEYGKVIPKGVLLYGPPGCGKTYITQALSSEIETPLYMLNISKAGSHYINMTAKNIKAAFDEAIEIADKSGKPCLVFMDEIDTVCFDRNSRMEPDDLKQVGTILQAMDKAKEHNVIIIGATNKYNLLDPAAKRRFDSKVFVDVPDTDSIISLLQKNLAPLRKGQNLLSNTADLEKIAKMLIGYSNSAICTISKEAAMCALRRGRADIEVQDYENAIKNTNEEKPSRKDYLAESKIESKRIGFNA